jgi:hypothetical protein
VRNLKYKDRGKKKANFYKNDPYLNDYYNVESIGGGNSGITVDKGYIMTKDLRKSKS